MLAIENLTAGYGDTVVLNDVALTVRRGEFVGLIGPNGCGKTTLLRTVSGVLAPMAGRVLLKGVPVHEMGRRALARVMACLSQDLTLDLPFTVREVALMGRTPHLPRIGAETQKDLDIVARAMDVTETAHLANRAITELSGGERQRAFIALCLAQEPEVFLLDEPTSHLDIGHQLSVLGLIADLNRATGVTVVAVLHDLNLAAEFCHRLILLDRGKVRAMGRPEEVLTSQMIREVYAADVLTERNPVSHKPHIVVAAREGRSDTTVSEPAESAGLSPEERTDP